MRTCSMIEIPVNTLFNICFMSRSDLFSDLKVVSVCVYYFQGLHTFLTSFNVTRLVLIYVVGSLALLTGFGAPRLLDRDVAPTVRIHTVQLSALANALQPPELTARAVLLYDVDSDRMLLRQEIDLPLPSASLTKLMTALIVLESGNLGAQVNVEEGDLVGGATMGLVAGEILTVDQLLMGLLIASGNDAAQVLARHVGGTVDNFVTLMNQRAVDLMLTKTAFANPHGIDADGHVSTAHDLLLLTRALLPYQRFREIVQMDSAEVADHILRNTNQLLGDFPGADGVKTGTTPAAGQNIVASVTRDGHRVLIIVLGSRNRYSDVRSLYRHYEQSYRWSNAGTPTLRALNRINGPDNERWYIEAQGEKPQILQSAQDINRLTGYRHIQLPHSDQIWYSGMPIGVLEWRMGDEVIGTQPLVLR